MSVQQYCYVGPYFELPLDIYIILNNDYNNGDDFAEKFREDLFFRPLENKYIFTPEKLGTWAHRYDLYSGADEVLELIPSTMDYQKAMFTAEYAEVFNTLNTKYGCIPEIKYGVINYMS